MEQAQLEAWSSGHDLRRSFVARPSRRTPKFRHDVTDGRRSYASEPAEDP